MPRWPKTTPATSTVPSTQAVENARIERLEKAVSLLLNYINDKDQIPRHGQDSDLYWIAREFRSEAELG